MKEVEPQEKPAKKKRRLAPVLFGLLFLVGFGILQSVEYIPTESADQ